MENVLFISDTSDGLNWGCHATSKELRSLINDKYNIQETIFLNGLKIPISEFILPDIADIKYLLTEYSKVLSSSGNKFENFYRYGLLSNKHIFDYLPKTAEQFDRRAQLFLESSLSNEYFEAVNDIDHVIINGEGSIHDNGLGGYRTAAWTILFLAYISKQKLGLNTHIVNHTLDVETNRFQSIIEMVYPLLDTIIFREPRSVQEYTSMVSDTNVVVASDSAWLLDNLLTTADLNDLVQNNALNVWHPKKKDYEFNFNCKYLCIGAGSGFSHSTNILTKSFVNLINLIQSEKKAYKILLVSASSADEQLMLNISQKEKLPLIKQDTNHKIAASILANSELYVGGRWHVSIFSLLGEGQLVNISGNTHKLEGLKEQIDGEYPIFRPKDIINSPREIAISVYSALENEYEVPNKTVTMKKFARKNVNI